MPMIQPLNHRMTITVSLVVLFFLLAWHFAGPVSTGPGWRWEEYRGGLEAVSEIISVDGDLYVTLERRKFQGRVLKLSPGKVEVILDGLNKPSGIVVMDGSLFVTVEGQEPGLLVRRGESTRYLPGVIRGEGIDRFDAHHVIVIEDNRENGRLLKVNIDNFSIDVLLTGLNEGEGVCLHPDRRIFYTEKKLNRLSVWDGEHSSIVLDDLYRPSYISCLQNGDLLISEDSSNRGRLLRLATDGSLEVIARRLKSPQAALVLGNGDILLAEQGQDRILRLFRE